jgi:hypothetical protein
MYRTFVSTSFILQGADLKERVTLTEPEVMEFVDSLRASLSVVENLPFPTIAGKFVWLS